MIETPTEILAHYADHDACDSFIAWRKRVRKPLTERAALMIARTLSAINSAGGNATEALDLAQEHGWMTIKADWYWNQKRGSQRHAQRTDRATERFTAFLAGARETS